MKTCQSCFRYCEDWRDAKAKDLNERYVGHGDYHYKPRNGVKPKCIAGKDQDGLYIACEYHEYRWYWNFKTWWTWRFIQGLREWYRKNIRVPLGQTRKPIPLEYKDYYDGLNDRIIRLGEPVCPHCRNMPYSYEQCVFCGQRFVKKEVEV